MVTFGKIFKLTVMRNKNEFRSKERSCNRVREREIERDAYNYASVEPAVGSRQRSGRSKKIENG